MNILTSTCIAAVAAAASLALPAETTAQPIVEPLFSAGRDTLGNPIEYDATAAPEISGASLTIMPGDRTGWHLHPVPAMFFVLSGEITVEYATGETRIFRAGDSGIEALNVAHDGRNDAEEPFEAIVFYAGARGAPTAAPADPPRPEEFADLQDVIPGLQIELRYFGSNNFVGRRIAGYERNVAWLTRPAAIALRDVQRELNSAGLGLKVFDGYRPQRAVDDFMQWTADADDIAMKTEYYPTIEKSELVPNGYVARRSGHSRGSTVDLTLIELASGIELDMGSPYDYFDPVSWPSSTAVSETAFANRMKLRDVMVRHGFEPLEEEWWHFTLRDEPWPDRYFDFPVR